MRAAGRVLSASGGLALLYVGPVLLMGLFGTSCMCSPVVTYVSRWVDRSRGAAVALISSAQSLSGALRPCAFQTGVTEFGWRRAMPGLRLLVAGAVLVVAALLPRPPPPAPQQRRARPDAHA